MINKFEYLKIKSLFNKYLLNHGEVVHNHKINLSLIKKEIVEDERLALHNSQPFTVEIEIQGTGIKLKKELYKLDNVAKQNVIKWCEEFRQIANSANWTNETSVSLLKEIVPDNIRQELTLLTTVESCLTRILKIVYPMKLAEIYLRKAKAIKQRDYYFIENYLKALKRELRKYFISAQLSEEVQKNKMSEIFFENLEVETKMYLFEKEIRNPMEAATKIAETEAFLLSLPSERRPLEETMRPFASDTQKTFKSRTVKWCPKHRTSNHDRSECFQVRGKVMSPQRIQDI